MTQENNSWEKWAHVATISAALAAVWGLWLTSSSIDEQVKANSPYVNVSGNSLALNSGSNEFVLDFIFKNYGNRPASNLRVNIVWMQCEVLINLDEKNRVCNFSPFTRFKKEVVNDLPPQGQFLLDHPMSASLLNDRAYIVVDISYTDRKLDKTETQYAFFKYQGGNELLILDSSEKPWVEERYRGILKDM